MQGKTFYLLLFNVFEIGRKLLTLSERVQLLNYILITNIPYNQVVNSVSKHTNIGNFSTRLLVACRASVRARQFNSIQKCCFSNSKVKQIF